MIDLRSDTVTKPSAGMRRAMADAEVGDDILDGDPTTVRLEARTAELLGCEAALFFPSGTMANHAAVMTLTQPGTEFFVHDDSHILNLEMAGAAVFAGVQPRVLRGAPRVTAEQVHAAVRLPSRDAPRASLLCLENTHAGSGGMVTSASEQAAIAALGRANRMMVHLDGARLWNASAATGSAPRAFPACPDTTMGSFPKAPGAPEGAALAGSAAVMDAVWDARKRLGGGMRQSGVIAAAALYGLENNLARLGDDHALARELAARLGAVQDVSVVAPQTNIVMVDLPLRLDANTVAAALEKRGVKVSVWHASRIRVVTHLDVTAAEVATAATVICDVLS